MDAAAEIAAIDPRRRRGLVRTLLLIGVLALLPAQAAAGWLSGPALQLRAEGRYDSNLLEGGGDGSSVIQPGVGWRLESPTAALEALYIYELVSYAHGGVGRGGANHRLSGRQDFQLDRRTTISLLQSYERVYDPTSLSRPGVVRTAGSSDYGRADAELSHRFSARWSGGFRVQEEFARVEAAGTLDGAVHGPAAWASYQWDRRTRSGLRYQLQYFETFDGSDAAANELRFSFGRILSKTLTLEAEAGPALYTMGGASQVVPVGHVALGRVWYRATVRLVYERSLYGSTGFEGALWGDNVSLIFNWRISEPLRASVAVGAFQNGVAPADDAFVAGFAGAAALEYALGGDLFAQIGWRRVSQSQLQGGGPAALDLSRNIFAMGLAWQLGGGQLRR